MAGEFFTLVLPGKPYILRPLHSERQVISTGSMTFKIACGSLISLSKSHSWWLSEKKTILDSENQISNSLLCTYNLSSIIWGKLLTFTSLIMFLCNCRYLIICRVIIKMKWKYASKPNKQKILSNEIQQHVKRII